MIQTGQCNLLTWVTKMKSLPRPWYLAKWRKPLSLLSRNEVEEVFAGVWMLIEDATMPDLGYFTVCWCLSETQREVEKEDEEEDRREARDRWIGAVIGRETSAAMAMTDINVRSCLLSLALAELWRESEQTLFFFLCHDSFPQWRAKRQRPTTVSEVWRHEIWAQIISGLD